MEPVTQVSTYQTWDVCVCGCEILQTCQTYTKKKQHKLDSKSTLVRHPPTSSNPNFWLWMVHSNQEAQYYTITQEQHNCPINCCLLYADWNICVHGYNCNCPDALIHNTICQHIHFVTRYQHMSIPWRFHRSVQHSERGWWTRAKKPWIVMNPEKLSVLKFTFYW